MSDSDDLPRRSPPAVLLAVRFLLPLNDASHPDCPNWRSAGRWLVFWGLVIGILYAVVFRLAWRWFGEYQYIRWLPAVAVLAVDLGLCGFRLLEGATSIVSGRQPCGRNAPVVPSLPGLLAVVLVSITKYALLLSLPLGVWRAVPAGAWDQATWVARIGPLYPEAVYRPLILMPLWGRWAIMLASSVGRTVPEASPRLSRMAGGTPLVLILVYWLLAAALTGLYCSGASNYLARGLAIPLGVMVVAYLTAFLLARRSGGHTEATVTAAGLAAELAFMCLYVPVASSIYWY